MKKIHQFLNDLLDRSAKPSGSVKLPDLWAAGLVTIPGVASYTDIIQKLGIQFLGVSGSLLPIIIILLVYIWCVFVISSKEVKQVEIPLSLPDQTHTILCYSYGQSARYLAKGAMIALILLVPKNIQSAIEEFVPLPSTFYGYIINARTGEPIEDAKVRVVTAHGVDVTKGNWLSDSKGFYIIETTTRIKRTAVLSIYRSGCIVTDSLPLKTLFETVIDISGKHISYEQRPTFKHTINCGGNK